MQAVTIDRNKYIGGSDIPIIMGISPFKTRFDLLLEKAGLKENDFTGNEYTEYGNIMEPKIRNYMCEIDHTDYKEDKLIKDDIRCHVDGYDGAIILEIKTTSQIHNTVVEYKVYLVQLLFYMYHYNKAYGQLCVYERPDDFNEKFDKKRLQIFDVELDDYKDLLERINNEVERFRNDLFIVKQNPFITEEELLPIDLTELSNKLLVIEEQLKFYDELVKQQKELKNQLKKAMENNNVKKWTTNNGTQITLIPDGENKEVTKFNEEKFKEENTDIYNKYLETKTQKGKTGYVKITLPKEE